MNLTPLNINNLSITNPLLNELIDIYKFVYKIVKPLLNLPTDVRGSEGALAGRLPGARRRQVRIQISEGRILRGKFQLDNFFFKLKLFILLNRGLKFKLA